MELGLGSYAFRWAVGTPAFRPTTPLSLVGMVDSTAELGCTLLQIADSAALEALDAEGRAALRQHAAAAGVRLQTGTSGLTESRMRMHLEIARDLEADIVRVVLDADGVHPDEDECVRVLSSVATDFADAGITIAIENHFLTPSTEIVSIIERVHSAAVGVCLDTANSIMVQEWPAKTVELLAPHAVNMHLKDYAVESDQNGVGGHVVGRRLAEGWLDISAVLDAVAHADRRRDGRLGVIIEQWMPLAHDEIATLESERSGREANVTSAREILSRRVEGLPGTPRE